MSAERKTIPAVLNDPGIAKNVVPITFDPEQGFLIGAEPHTAIKPVDLRDVEWSRYESVQSMSELVMGMLHGVYIFTGPRFHDFVDLRDSANVIAETPRIMLRVYNQLSQINAKARDIGKGFGYFDAQCKSGGSVVLHVQGSCACLDTIDHRFISPEEHEHTLYREYEMHNVDNAAQYASLLAGLGYIAGKATLEVTRT